MVATEFAIDSIFDLQTTGLNPLNNTVFYDFSDDALRKRVATQATFDASCFGEAMIHPFVRQYCYIVPTLTSPAFPTPDSENTVIALSAPQSDDPFTVLMSNTPVDRYFAGRNSETALFPYYVYEGENNRYENITDDALALFQHHYRDEFITKWDVFTYVYALLHHPHYKHDSYKYTLPLITLVPDFTLFSQAGKRLSKLHLGYERMRRYRLEWDHDGFTTTTYHVKQMTFNEDKSAIRANHAFTLRGIPAHTYDYTLGGKSPLDWVVEHYYIHDDPFTGVKLNPNLFKDTPQEGGRYILLLAERVLNVSLETRRILHSLEALPLLA